MRTVDYERHEFQAELPVLVCDIRYFGACGIFPPFHIANAVFSSGGSEGGMGPGATWEPCEISGDEYEQLLRVKTSLDPRTLGDRARYASVKYRFDNGFDHIREREAWLQSVREKHRDALGRARR